MQMKIPVSRTPHLLALPDSIRRGKQIPQVSVILRLILETPWSQSEAV